MLIYLPAPQHLHRGSLAVHGGQQTPGNESQHGWQPGETLTLRQRWQATLPGWFTLSFARASSSLSLLQCSHVIPPDLYQILVQVGPTYCYKLDANLFPTPLPGTIACLLAQLGKISVGLGSVPRSWRNQRGNKGALLQPRQAL